MRTSVEAGCVVRVAIELTPEELAPQGVKLPEGQVAELVLSINLVALLDRFVRALKSKGRRTAIERGAFEIRTAGARPAREPEPLTVREPSCPPEGL